MAICKEKDVLIDLLKEYGFCPVALPRTGIEPLQILELGDRYEQTTHLQELFEVRKPYNLPEISDDKAVPNELQGKLTTRVKKQNALELMKNWITSMKGIIGEIEQDYNSADKIQFDFNNPKINTIDWAKLDKYVNNAVIETSAPSYLEKLKSGKLYVIVSIIKSNSFTVSSIDENGKSFSANISANKIGKVNKKTSRNVDNTLSVTYQGDEMLIFGIKAVKLKYDDKTKIIHIINPERAVMKNDENISVEKLEIDDNFIDI